jgi:hypothetical protein
MWARIEDNKIVQTISNPKALTINDIQYPSSIFTNAWTDEERKAIGILPYEYSGSLIDNIFYKTFESAPDIQENKVVVTRTNTARNIDDVKNTMKTHVNSVLASCLSQTDWIVIRKADTDKDAPSDLAKWRTDFREKAEAYETAINNASDISGLEAINLNDWPDNPRRDS